MPALVQAGFACITELLIAGIRGKPLWGHVHPQEVLAVIWLGVAGTAITYLIYFHLIRVWGSTRTSINTYFQPFVGVSLGVLVLGERLEPRVWGAIAITTVGTALFAAGNRMRALLRWPLRKRSARPR